MFTKCLMMPVVALYVLRYEKSREMWRDTERFSHKRLTDEWEVSGGEKSKRHDDKLLFSSEKPVNNRQRVCVEWDQSRMISTRLEASMNFPIIITESRGRYLRFNEGIFRRAHIQRR